MLTSALHSHDIGCSPEWCLQQFNKQLHQLKQRHTNAVTWTNKNKRNIPSESFRQTRSSSNISQVENEGSYYYKNSYLAKKKSFAIGLL